MTQPLLDGRVAIVTGAGQGIGREIARVLHAHGARVVLVDLDGEAAKAAADELDRVGLGLRRHLRGAGAAVGRRHA